MRNSQLLLLSLAMFAALTSGTSRPTPDIEIQSGSIRGVVVTLPDKSEVRKYLGIPYAKAERFERPVAPDSWTGVKDATAFGKVCIQRSRTPSTFSYTSADMSEDCLNLNVYVPNTQTSKLLPVMVWIHGGGFIANSNRIADGSYLATLGDVVVVSINYRLGLFGFLASKDYGLTGNYGLYDQLQALKWVKSNIKKFGGDPKRVTIFGNSAGGASVSILSMTPLAKGLFKYTIMQSGVANIPIGYESYEDKSLLKNFAGQKFNCTDDTTMKACLKRLSATQIMKAGYGHPSFYTPVIDGQFLTEVPLDMVKNTANTLNPERVMIGVADDDGSCLTNAIPALSDGFVKIFRQPGVTNKNALMNYVGMFRKYLSKIPETDNYCYTKAIEKTYMSKSTNFANPNENHRILLDILKDMLFYGPGVAHAEAYVKRNIPTYFYEVKYGLPMPGYFTVPSLLNGYHETEKFMVFGFALKSKTQRQSTGGRLSREVIRMWSNFAKTGNPNSPVTSTSQVHNWPQYTSSNQKFLVIKPSMEVQEKIRSREMGVWNTYFPSLGQATKPATKTSISKKKENQKPKLKHKPIIKSGPFGLW